jgi:hypothetical protein
MNGFQLDKLFDIYGTFYIIHPDEDLVTRNKMLMNFNQNFYSQNMIDNILILIRTNYLIQPNFKKISTDILINEFNSVVIVKTMYSIFLTNYKNEIMNENSTVNKLILNGYMNSKKYNCKIFTTFLALLMATDFNFIKDFIKEKSLLTNNVERFIDVNKLYEMSCILYNILNDIEYYKKIYENIDVSNDDIKFKYIKLSNYLRDDINHISIHDKIIDCYTSKIKLEKLNPNIKENDYHMITWLEEFGNNMYHHNSLLSELNRFKHALYATFGYNYKKVNDKIII